MNKRILALLLCGIMLIGMFAGCVNQQEEGEESSKVEEDSNWVNPELEFNENLKDKTFNILSMRESDIGPEENSSDPLEDAVYRRNDMINNYYGIEISGILDGDYNSLSQKVKTDVTAGTGDYDLVYQHMVDAATNLGMQGNLYNLADLEYVNFDNPWWDQDCKNGFMFGDNMYVVCGDLLPSSMLITAAIVFNKNLFDERSWDYPYDDAREGTWTLDDMITMTKDQNQDLNGDGKLIYSDDFYGLVGWSLDCDYNFYFGSGATMFTFDDDHLPIYEANADRLQTIYEKIYELIVTQKALHVTVAEYNANNEMYKQPAAIFKSGRALFFAGYLSGATDMRDMQDDFGILPQPKFDEKQEEYLSFVNGAASVACVPKSLSEEQLAITGYMMEVLASSSYYMVTETLYEKVAKSKTARDPESAAMVDVIIRHKVFDFGYTHFYSHNAPCATIIQTALNSGSASITRDITKGEKTTMKNLKKIYEQYGYDFYD